MRDFELPAQDERPVRLARELAGGAVVLVFYCGDWCPYCGGQLAELTGLYDEFRSAGAEVIGVSVDPPGRAAGLTETLRIPFPLVSDPDGAAAMRPFGVWDATRSLARPATVAIRPGHLEIARFEGMDYADRPLAQDILDRVRELDLHPRELRSGRHPFVDPEPSERAFPRESLPTYFCAVRSAATAIYERTGSEDARLVAELGGRYYDAVRR